MIDQIRARSRLAPILALILIVAACSTGTSSPAAESAAPPSASAAPAPESQAPSASAGVPGALAQKCTGKGAGGKCKVVLINSFVGNPQRVFMMKTAELAAGHEPYKSLWDFSTLTSDNTAEAQNAAIENLLSQGVDAILLDSVSDTSASDVIAKACDQGVLVVSFDVADQSAAPCQYTLEFANHFYTETAGQWLGKAVDCKGNAILDKGLQGVGIAEAQHQGSVDGLKKACGDKIKIAAEFFGEFGPGPATTALTALAATTPDVTVLSVLTNGDVGFGVFEAAGKPAPALYTYYSNQAGQECLKAGRKCVFINVSMGYGQGAMDVAYRIMGGQDVPRKSDFAYEFLATDTSIDVGVPMTKLEEGKNTWADKPATFNYFFNWPGAVVQLTEEEAFGS